MFHQGSLREKVFKYGVFSGPYFPVFGLNTEIYSVNLAVIERPRKNIYKGKNQP